MLSEDVKCSDSDNSQGVGSTFPCCSPVRKGEGYTFSCSQHQNNKYTTSKHNTSVCVHRNTSHVNGYLLEIKDVNLAGGYKQHFVCQNTSASVHLAVNKHSL